MPSPRAESPPSARLPLWVRGLSGLPLTLLYGLASCVAFLSHRVFPHRMHVVRENLTKAFPELDEATLRSVIGRFYLGFAQIAVEILKGATLPAAELQRRVRVVNIDLPRAELAQGRSVLLMTAHQCNWEWQLQALALGLGYPYYVAYKPLRNPWAERLMYAIRTRFGARLLPAPQLMPDLLKNKDVPRGISLAVDQEPPKDERKHWVPFLNRDTAFYMGADRIVRATGHPVFFVRMRRIARGNYELEFRLIAAAGEKLRVGELTERYAREVESQIRESPPDWPWSHKRWRLRR